MARMPSYLSFLSWFWLFLPLSLLSRRTVPHSLIDILPTANKNFFQQEVVASTCISWTRVRGRVVTSSPCACTCPPPPIIVGLWVLFEMSEVGWEVALVDFLSSVRLTDLKTFLQLRVLSMHCLQGPTWVGQPGDGEKRNTQRRRNSQAQFVWALGWRHHGTLEAQCIYCVDLNRKAELMHTAEQGRCSGRSLHLDKQGGRVYGMQLAQRFWFTKLIRSCLCGRALFRSWRLRGWGCSSEQFLNTLSTCALRISMGLGARVNSVRALRISLSQGFLCSLKLHN